ncbi:nucleoside-diphosphate-sugar epimerase [Diaminobutyricimonas aerilata]|uniref:Nucleoside-diphosphate-sugar epimerase n=1 Tax=Diaminobutyricimonas aerilata TaxID=1162967 RepID=A0A2M9CHT0_9MICO|nr:NAD(P)-dependent oxidoreductase [Diaminobutyricimonas aerilata]PJJ71429.1 nucleoside-diphosphate-sugar epimerase [Diaminobutyricimonas aerilata]
MRIAVTGASGFVGGAVATALADRDHEVVGFGRDPNGWSHPRARYRSWDFVGGPLLGDRDFDAVVHCAALVDETAPRAEAMRINRDGTRTVIRSFRTTRFVHLSSAAVYDNLGANVEVTESQAGGTALCGYSESKAAAELEFAGTDFVILRPRAVYGPGDALLIPRILGQVRRGRLALPEGSEVRQTLTSLPNLVRAVECALRPGAPTGVYNVGDDTPVLLSAVLRELLARKGMGHVRITPVPFRAAFAAATALERTAALARRRPGTTRFAVAQFGRERTLDLTAARERLGFRPRPTSLDGAERW